MRDKNFKFIAKTLKISEEMAIKVYEVLEENNWMDLSMELAKDNCDSFVLESALDLAKSKHKDDAVPANNGVVKDEIVEYITGRVDKDLVKWYKEFCIKPCDVITIKGVFQKVNMMCDEMNYKSFNVIVAKTYAKLRNHLEKALKNTKDVSKQADISKFNDVLIRLFKETLNEDNTGKEIVQESFEDNPFNEPVPEEKTIEPKPYGVTKPACDDIPSEVSLTEEQIKAMIVAAINYDGVANVNELEELGTFLCFMAAPCTSITKETVEFCINEVNKGLTHCEAFDKYTKKKLEEEEMKEEKKVTKEVDVNMESKEIVINKPKYLPPTFNDVDFDDDGNATNNDEPLSANRIGEVLCIKETYDDVYFGDGEVSVSVSESEPTVIETGYDENYVADDEEYTDPSYLSGEQVIGTQVGEAPAKPIGETTQPVAEAKPVDAQPTVVETPKTEKQLALEFIAGKGAELKDDKSKVLTNALRALYYELLDPEHTVEVTVSYAEARVKSILESKPSDIIVNSKKDAIDAVNKKIIAFNSKDVHSDVGKIALTMLKVYVADLEKEKDNYCIFTEKLKAKLAEILKDTNDRLDEPKVKTPVEPVKEEVKSEQVIPNVPKTPLDKSVDEIIDGMYSKGEFKVEPKERHAHTKAEKVRSGKFKKALNHKFSSLSLKEVFKNALLDADRKHKDGEVSSDVVRIVKALCASVSDLKVGMTGYAICGNDLDLKYSNKFMNAVKCAYGIELLTYDMAVNAFKACDEDLHWNKKKALGILEYRSQRHYWVAKGKSGKLEDILKIKDESYLEERSTLESLYAILTHGKDIEVALEILEDAMIDECDADTTLWAKLCKGFKAIKESTNASIVELEKEFENAIDAVDPETGKERSVVRKVLSGTRVIVKGAVWLAIAGFTAAATCIFAPFAMLGHGLDKLLS